MSRKSSPKQALFEQLALMARAMGSASRLELLDYLAQGERSVENLATVCQLSIANTSKHLRQLREMGLVTSRQDGLYVYYRMADDHVTNAVNALRTLATHRIDTVDQLLKDYLISKDDMEPVNVTNLMTRAEQGLVTILDVRPEEEYRHGHLPDAINMPLEQLKKHLGTLPRNHEIIAYCRGPWCVLSYEAVSMLRKNGYKARRLDVGLPEWRQHGLPVHMTTGTSVP